MKFAIFCHQTSKLMIIMEQLLKQINEQIASFQKDANLQVEKGNKAAGTRARKATLEISKLMKEFRKASLEASK